MQQLLRRIPAPITGPACERSRPCGACGSSNALLVGEVEYWDLKHARLVKCTGCNNIQLDPMLTREETSLGCHAYYVEESLRTSTREELKNRVRNFRRGVLFAHGLKSRGIAPTSILELGPGSGYFCAGIKFVMPQVRVHVMDINQALLDHNLAHHGFQGILAIPDEHVPTLDAGHDLVIARDILEHVTHIGDVVTNVCRYLRPGGHFHFITPNGHEDVWKHHLTHLAGEGPSELLINHVNYFDGLGLKELLRAKGFEAVEYYTYGLKWTRRGRGWKRGPGLKAATSRAISASGMIAREKDLPVIGVPSKKLLAKWYITPDTPWITRLYSAWQHSHLLRLDPTLNVGHEIFGIFRKQ